MGTDSSNEKDNTDAPKVVRGPWTPSVDIVEKLLAAQADERKATSAERREQTTEFTKALRELSADTGKAIDKQTDALSAGLQELRQDAKGAQRTMIAIFGLAFFALLALAGAESEFASKWFSFKTGPSTAAALDKVEDTGEVVGLKMAPASTTSGGASGGHTITAGFDVP
jgi:hypothetical protein